MPRWMDRAECRNLGDEGRVIFFPDIKVGQTSPRVWDEARKYCDPCQVKLECLNYQMDFEEITARRDGMFGGLTPKERDRLADERRKSRR